MRYIMDMNWPHWTEMSDEEFKEKYEPTDTPGVFWSNGQLFVELTKEEAISSFNQARAGYLSFRTRLAEQCRGGGESPYPEDYTFSREKPIWRSNME